MSKIRTGASWSEVGSGGRGIVLCHPWWGLSEGVREIGYGLADAGFLVVMPDLYDGRTTLDLDMAERLRSAFPLAVRQERFDAAVEHLLAHPLRTAGPVGAVGLSLGAAWALGLAASQPEDVAAVVLYYGTGDPGDTPAVGSACLGHFAEDEEWKADEDVTARRDRLTAAEVDVRFHTYPGTSHWFAESDVPTVYDSIAADVAMRRTVAFLTERLLPPAVEDLAS